MNFESMRQMLQSNDMEEALFPRSSDIFNIFCKKDGEHINTIQIVDDESGNGERIISEKSLELLIQAISRHRLEEHQINHQFSMLYEDALKTTSKTKI